MNENIDLTKILKDCPEGTTLYSTIFGEVEFIECDNYLYQIVVDKEGIYYYFTSQGEFICEKIKYNTGECVLFPSRDQRDWRKFNAPWYKKEKFDPNTLNMFDRVLGRDCDNHIWKCDLFSHITGQDYFPYKCVGKSYKYCIPCNDDTKHLVGTKDEAPEYYRYLEDEL